MTTVAIVGATGAVGSEILSVLEKRAFPVQELRLLASPRSAGQTRRFRDQDLTIAPLEASAFDGVDIAFFSAGATRSREFAPIALEKGAKVVDNSSAFRMDPAIPLIVPEVNGATIPADSALIANPNCVATILAVALAPLDRHSPIERLVISTYQSASGAGAQAMEDLKVQTRAHLAGEPVIPKILKHPYAFNLFNHDSDIEENGYNGEENKVVAEVQKILGRPELGISVTSVRVPVLRAHSASINVTFGAPVSPEEARALLANAPGLALVDAPESNHFPMPNEATGQDPVLVGRIRKDPSHPNALNLFISGDQLLKGAALNAVQVAEQLLKG